MQVKHGLPGTGANVGNQPPTVTEAVVLSDPGCHGHHLGEHLRIDGSGDRFDVSSRNHQHMGRCSRVYVTEGDSHVRALDDVSRDISGDDPAEETIGAQSLVSPILTRRALKESLL